MEAITFSLRVTAPDREVARVSIGRRQFSVGRPLEFDDTSPRIAAMEYALGAAGGEIVNGLRVFAARRRLAIDAIEAVVTADLEHGLRFLEVVGEDGLPRIARMHVRVFVACADADAVRRLFDLVIDRLPLLGTLRRALDVTLDITVTT